MPKPLIAKAPAKLILSGEHAVVYGNPAIALAVNRYATCTIKKMGSATVLFRLLNLKYTKNVTLQTLKALKKRLMLDYQAFLNGNCSIRDVIEKPFELLQYTLITLVEKLHDPALGLELKTSSSIPIGCGMGSSAAAIVSTMKAATHFLKLNFSKEQLFNLGQESENLQHGYSSGLDIHLALNGGCVKFQQGKAKNLVLPNNPFNIVYTGKPQTTTGECVTRVAKKLENDSILLQDFADVTHAMELALIANNQIALQQAVKENNKLLIDIGVVPDPVQNFIKFIEKLGREEVRGAGAVAGAAAGVVLVLGVSQLQPICQDFGYVACKVQPNVTGVIID